MSDRAVGSAVRRARVLPCARRGSAAELQPSQLRTGEGHRPTDGALQRGTPSSPRDTHIRWSRWDVGRQTADGRAREAAARGGRGASGAPPPAASRLRRSERARRWPHAQSQRRCTIGAMRAAAAAAVRRTFGERHPRGNATSSGKHPARDETPKGRRSACAQCRGDTKEQGSSGPCGLHSVCVGDNSLLQGHRHKEVWFPRGGDYSHERETTQPKRNHHHHPTCLKPHRLPTKVDVCRPVAAADGEAHAEGRGVRNTKHQGTHTHTGSAGRPHTHPSLTHTSGRAQTSASPMSAGGI